MATETRTDAKTDAPKYRKPLPNIDADSRPQWEGFRQHRFLLYRCKVCQRWYWPKAYCRYHATEPFFGNMEWAEASGRGKVFVFNIVRIAFHPGFKDEVPYVHAMIELDEGPLFSSNVIGIDPRDVKIGMPVEVVYDDITPEHTLPKFRPVQSSAG
jgi:uncharacterized OB-fold protein